MGYNCFSTKLKSSLFGLVLAQGLYISLSLSKWPLVFSNPELGVFLSQALSRGLLRALKARAVGKCFSNLESRDRPAPPRGTKEPGQAFGGVCSPCESRERLGSRDRRPPRRRADLLGSVLQPRLHSAAFSPDSRDISSEW